MVFNSQTTCRAKASPKGKAKAKAGAKKATVKPQKLTKQKYKFSVFAVNAYTIQTANQIVCCMLLVFVYVCVCVAATTHPNQSTRSAIAKHNKTGGQLTPSERAAMAVKATHTHTNH